MKKLLTISLITLVVLVIGCRASVTVDKRANIALPIYEENATNDITKIMDWIIVDQGYLVKYSKWGFNTEIQSMTAELTTNKTVKFSIGGLSSTVSTNNVSIKFDDILQMVSLFRNSTNDVIVIDRNSILNQ